MRWFQVFLPILLFFGGCERGTQTPVTISANAWIGYTPLFYAQQRGWLEKAGFKLAHVVSLGESLYLYETGRVQVFAGTQYEYLIMHAREKELRPVVMFDRSCGGDMVMGNRSIDHLLESTGRIDLYLEMDSVNRIVAEDFLSHFDIAEKRINFINMDQGRIAALKNAKTLGPTLIVTYFPHNMALERTGFRELASTADGLDLAVFDALFASKAWVRKRPDAFRALKSAIEYAVRDIRSDPRKVYGLVKGYLENPTYEEFTAALGRIEWIDTSRTKAMEVRIERAQLPVDALL